MTNRKVTGKYVIEYGERWASYESWHLKGWAKTLSAAKAGMWAFRKESSSGKMWRVIKVEATLKPREDK